MTNNKPVIGQRFELFTVFIQLLMEKNLYRNLKFPVFGTLGQG